MSDEVRIAPAASRDMIALRADLSDKAVRAACTKLAGTGFPGRLEVSLDGPRGLAWMSPDELLLFVPPGEGPGTVAALGKALGARHHLVADVSDARALFEVSGPGPRVREVLARLSPVDLHPDAFPPGRFRRTRLAQVAAGIWLCPGAAGAGERFEVMVFRSVSDYAEALLSNAAAAPAAGL